jgi:hypothetical protein
LPVGYDRLNIDSLTPEGKTCYRYEILIVSNNTTVASASFLVVEKPDYGKVIRFLNAAGGYDVVCVKGMESKKRKGSVVEFETSVPLFYSASDAVYQKRISGLFDEFEIVLGSLTKQEVEHIKEILDSPFVWKQEGSSFIPIVITSDNIDLWDESQDLNAPKLTYRYDFPC